MKMTLRFLKPRELFTMVFALFALATITNSVSAQDTYLRNLSTGSNWADGNWLSGDNPVSVNPSAGDNVIIGDSVLPTGNFPVGTNAPIGQATLNVGSALGGATLPAIGTLTLGSTNAMADQGILNFDGLDSLSINSATLHNTSEINFSSSGGLTASSIDLLGSSVIDFSSATTANLNVSDLSITNNSRVDLSGGVLTGQIFVSDNGALNITTPSGSLGPNSSVTLDGADASLNLNGTATVDELNLINGASYNITASDVMNGDVSLTDNSALIFSQALNDTTGITLNSLLIDTDSTFIFNFDANSVVSINGLNDWVLEMDISQQGLLDSYIASGQIDFNAASSTGITRLTTFSQGSSVFVVGVPEPGTTGFLMLSGLLLFRRTRRKFA